MSIYGTETTNSNILNDLISLEKLIEVKKKFDTFKCPFEEFANRNGFSLDEGDFMFFPVKLKKCKDIPKGRKGIFFSELLMDNIVLCSGDWLSKECSKTER